MTAHRPLPQLPRAAHDELERALVTLEENTFASRLALLSFKIGGGTRDTASQRMLTLAEKMIEPVLKGTLAVAIKTLGEKGEEPTERAISRHIHKIAASLSGAAGGATGLLGLIAELPVTTLLMFRQIAAIARRNGEDLSDPAARLACLEVFALSGLGAASEAAGTTYYALRIALHGTLAQAGRILAGGGTSLGGRAISQIISRIAAQFGNTMARVAAARILPVAGAAGGAIINALFMDHYRKLAEAHFTIRRLERTYGHETVRRAYENLHRERTKKKNRA